MIGTQEEPISLYWHKFILPICTPAELVKKIDKHLYPVQADNNKWYQLKTPTQAKSKIIWLNA